MGRHSLPDARRAGGTGSRGSRRRRATVLTTALALGVAVGTAAVMRTDLLGLGGSCADTAVRLDVVASPDIAPAVREAADLARANEITSDGRCIDVHVTARESHRVADILDSGPSDPGFQVWIPDASLWLERVRTSAKAVRLTEGGNVASSPVVLAAGPGAADALGWPAKPYSWSGIAKDAIGSGKLRLGAADPARSATGLLALTRIGASAGQNGQDEQDGKDGKNDRKDGGDAQDGDTRLAAAAELISRRVSGGDSQVLRTLAFDGSGTGQDGPDGSQTVFLSEQAAFAQNADAAEGEALRLFHPEDGSPLLDYPFTLVDEADLSLDESRGALRFMTLMNADEAGTRILRAHGFRGEDGEAVPAIAKRAGGGSPQPFAAEPAEPFPANTVQKTLGLWTITVRSARLTMVVDASGSMADPVGDGGRSRMDLTKASLLQALAGLTHDDEVGLWRFSTRLDGSRDYEVLVPTGRLADSTGTGRTQRDRLTAAFRDLEPVEGGGTGLYDTTLAAYKEARKKYAPGKFNALVVLTDGANQDPDGISRRKLVKRLAGLTDPARPVPLIAIAVGPESDRDEVEEIAGATDGVGYRIEDPAQIHEVILRAVTIVGRT
ncbi:substrate-binding domain-containing protein [Streptomyces sp. GC420]|uniref:substrate-binding domain-containing protein n=1 Tax=Streptomyces sp. GC420 TaxID=2697568 RepID=UPI00141514D5|nr:substrate-binding domain-containing protein [Streptomyces sp. GC420]NBM16440.1 solute-binding protein [Streptomyces sp. GC420]